MHLHHTPWRLAVHRLSVMQAQTWVRLRGIEYTWWRVQTLLLQPRKPTGDVDGT